MVFIEINELDELDCNGIFLDCGSNCNCKNKEL